MGAGGVKVGLKGTNRNTETFVPVNDQSKDSDPKFEDHGCWAKSPELPFFGKDSGSVSFSGKLK